MNTVSYHEQHIIPEIHLEILFSSLFAATNVMLISLSLSFSIIYLLIHSIWMMKMQKNHLFNTKENYDFMEKTGDFYYLSWWFMYLILLNCKVDISYLGLKSPFWPLKIQILFVQNHLIESDLHCCGIICNSSDTN